MRLVWELIPLVLIVSMIGIVGVPESFALTSGGGYFKPSIELSKIPQYGDTIDITVTGLPITTTNDKQMMLPVSISLPDGLELLNSDDFTITRESVDRKVLPNIL